jgi:hypothetical protein
MMELGNKKRLDGHLHMCSKECAEAENQERLMTLLLLLWSIIFSGLKHVCGLKEVAATKCRFAGKLMALS